MHYYPHMENVEEKTFTPEEVADKLRLSVETVRRWLRSGRLKGKKLGPKTWRIAESDLDSLGSGK